MKTGSAARQCAVFRAGEGPRHDDEIREDKHHGDSFRAVQANRLGGTVSAASRALQGFAEHINILSSESRPPFQTTFYLSSNTPTDSTNLLATMMQKMVYLPNTAFRVTKP
jgi:hypothetical protein